MIRSQCAFAFHIHNVSLFHFPVLLFTKSGSNQLNSLYPMFHLIFTSPQLIAASIFFYQKFRNSNWCLRMRMRVRTLMSPYSPCILASSAPHKINRSPIDYVATKNVARWPAERFNRADWKWGVTLSLASVLWTVRMRSVVLWLRVWSSE